MGRATFSNQIIDAIIATCDLKGWTRDIPFDALTSALSDRDERGLTCVPARDSDNGRGSPIFDVYNSAVPIVGCGGMTAPVMVSLKVSSEEVCPRSIVVTTGTARHIAGLLAAIDRGTEVPLLCFNHSNETGWTVLRLDAGMILRENMPEVADKTEGNIVTLSEKHQTVKGKKYAYTSLRINVKPAIFAGYTLGWEAIDRPSLPMEVDGI